jgi:hypothetical protein
LLCRGKEKNQGGQQRHTLAAPGHLERLFEQRLSLQSNETGKMVQQFIERQKTMALVKNGNQECNL